jgi:hypothetical protein
MSGNFTVTATAKFLTEGNEHRKAVVMLRQSLDADSPFVHLVIHGNGMPGVQFRKTTGDNTNTVDLPIEGPGTWTMKLVGLGVASHTQTAYNTVLFSDVSVEQLAAPAGKKQ